MPRKGRGREAALRNPLLKGLAFPLQTGALLKGPFFSAVIRAGTKAAEGMSAADLAKRTRVSPVAFAHKAGECV